MSQKLRSLFFDFLFYTLSPLYLTCMLPLAYFFGRPFAQWVCHFWGAMIFKGLKIILKLDYKIEGAQYLEEIRKKDPNNINKNSAIIVTCKHESVLENFLFAYLLDDFYVVAKKELMRIPVFGSYLKLIEAIIVDRSNGAVALRGLIRRSKPLIESKKTIVIFPEGTRRNTDEPNYKRGVLALYCQKNVKVYPMTLNVGSFWGRHSFFKKSGTITVRFLPSIPSNLSKEEFMKTLQEQTEGCFINTIE